MDVERQAVGSVEVAWHEEIENAIDRVKRTKFDKWMRTEWHKAGARERWTAGRKAGWVRWSHGGETRGMLKGGE